MSYSNDSPELVVLPEELAEDFGLAVVPGVYFSKFDVEHWTLSVRRSFVPDSCYPNLEISSELEGEFLMQIPPVIPTMGSVGMAVLIGAMVIVALLIIRRRGEGFDGR